MPSVIVTNARVWTGSERRRWAGAVAVASDRISAIGSSAEVMKLAGPATRIIDARGVMVLPGFIDSHMHLIPSSLRLSSVQLRDAASPQELVRRLEAFAGTVPTGQWITGGDWDHYRWGGELPTREWIDTATPAHPVFITRHDGHMGLANSLALRAAGVDASTEEPYGGVIVRDGSGSPTGVLKDEAIRLVLDRVPPPSLDEMATAVGRGCRYLAKRGVTSVHHMGSWADVEVLRAARESGVLRTRTYAAVPMNSQERLRDEIAAKGAGDDWLRLGAVKAFMDGSLGSHTAAFLEPYSDTPPDRGLFVMEPEELREQTAAALAHGLQPVVHAIGDRAVRTVLDIFSATSPRAAPVARPFRIEHAQHVNPVDVPRFAQLGVIASMQPYHLADDGRWAEEVIGAERVPQSFPIGSLMRAGATVAFGSDWYVAPPEPLQAIHAAVTRETLDGLHPEGWTASERISLEEALLAHTVHGALAEGATSTKGTLERGRLADLVMVDRDLTSAPSQAGEARVVLTMVGGEIVYEEVG